MALLDFLNQSNVPFNGAYPSSLFGEADMSQAAREAAALRLARGVKRSPAAEALSVFDMGAAPLSMAGSGALGLDPSIYASAPAQDADVSTSPQVTGPVPLPRPRPAEAEPAPSDVSSVNRSIGAPLSLAPAMPAASAAPEAPGFMDRLSNGLAANPMTLMTLGAGIAQGGVGKGLQYAAAGAQADRTNQQKTASQNATVTALRARGVPDSDIALAMQSPDALKAMLARIYPDPTKAPNTKVVKDAQGTERLATWDQKTQSYKFQEQPDTVDGHPTYGLGKSGTQELDKSRAERIAALQAGGAGGDQLAGSIDRASDVVRSVLQDGDIGGAVAIPGVRTAATVFGTEAEGRRQRLEASLNAIKLASSQAELKGQGAVSDRERELIASLSGGVNTINRQTLLENLQELQDIQRGKQWMRDQYLKVGGDPFTFDREYGPKLSEYMTGLRRQRGGNVPTLPSVPEQPTGQFKVMGVR